IRYRSGMTIIPAHLLMSSEHKDIDKIDNTYYTVLSEKMKFSWEDSNEYLYATHENGKIISNDTGFYAVVYCRLNGWALIISSPEDDKLKQIRQFLYDKETDSTTS